MAQDGIVRIYQGRAREYYSATRDSDSGGDDRWRKEEEARGAELLWDHHRLFQDATNYYLVALAALADSEHDEVMAQLCQQLEGCWKAYARRGITRIGLQECLRPYIGDCPDLRSAMAKILEGNEASVQVRAAALQQLLEQCKGDIQQSGREYLPRFCSPDYAGKYASESKAKEAGLESLAALLHDGRTSDKEIRERMRLEWFANIYDDRPPKTGAAAKSLLEEAAKFLGGQNPECQPHNQLLCDAVSRLPEDSLRIPSYSGGSINKQTLKHRFYLALLIKFLPEDHPLMPLLIQALRGQLKTPRSQAASSTAESATGTDPVRAARGTRGYVFPAFTALRVWIGGDGMHCTWKEFDIAAFKEALKIINQFYQQQQERQAKRERLERQIAWIRDGQGDPHQAFSDAEWQEAERLPGTLAGDPRWQLLQQLLEEELAVCNEITDGERLPYRIRQRTLRGFRELAEQWNRRLNQDPQTTPQDLLAICTRYQADHRDDIGSITLFRALVERPERWEIWRTPSDERRAERERRRWSESLLEDVACLHQLEEELADLRQPVSLTPADADHSPRFFMPSDLTGRTEGKLIEHEGKPAIELTIACRSPEGWRPARMRVRYSAPRLQRDGLLSPSGQWSLPMLQPFVPALPGDAIVKNVKKMAMQLAPDRRGGSIRVLINFPVTLDAEQVRRKVSDIARWTDRQCNAIRGSADELPRLLHLHWPETTRLSKGKQKADWWTVDKPFAVLGVDLGQRCAASMVRLRVSPAASPAEAGSGWHLGQAGGREWNATLEGMRIARLPGEDAGQWQGASWQREPYGERGRLATSAETEAAKRIARVCTVAEIPEEEFEGLTFPQQNDKLLVVIGRTQGWLARCHRWRWMLIDPQRSSQASQEIAQDPRVPPEVRAETATAEQRLCWLDAEIARWRRELPERLLEVTQRVLPLRRQRWEWVQHPVHPDCHLLRRVPTTDRQEKIRIRGQRGLSLARIEQLERLRKRWQSLNRALQIRPGQPPRSGRELRDRPVPDPCPDILEKLEQLREQRINQTAHWIVAEALGVELQPPGCAEQRRAAHLHGAYRRREMRGQELDPVAMIVFEDLSRYRTSQDRPPSENTRLMQWCHRAILTKVKMMCEPLGILVLETNAAYSSRFCSRTGVAGFRAIEVTDRDRHRHPWKGILQRCQERREQQQPLEDEDRLVEEVFARLSEWSAHASRHPRTLLLPQAGGPLFVPMVDWSFAGQNRPGIQQADINAALNIALRGIVGPHARRIRLRLRCDKTPEGVWKPKTESLLERAANANLPALSFPESRDSQHLTAFVDWGGVAQFDIADLALPDGRQVRCASGKGLWASVKRRQWQRIRDLNHQRIERWRRAVLPF
ncbi:MAG: type V CRISPR-associated protein Cas12b [Chloroflexota bacterium]|nr:type V CRISPR-associated protein Cas12b [Chloroflexota bacterium]